MKDQIKRREDELRAASDMKSVAESGDDEDRVLKILKMQVQLKEDIINLYRQLGDAVIAYNSKYSIAAQLAQMATAATKIAEAL